MSRAQRAVATSPVVLIVEDEPELAEVYEDYIDEACDVRVATTGDEALSLIDHNVDVALLDRKLGEWSGDELVHVIRERQIDCGIVMVTAVQPDVDIVGLPVDDYLTKPAFEEDLKAAIDEILYRQVGGADRREFLALISRKIALESQLDQGELAGKPEFRKLERRIALAEDRLDLKAVADPDEDRPDTCPECGLRWDVRIDGSGTAGYVEIGTWAWKCRGCGTVENLTGAAGSEPVDERTG